MLCSRPNQKEAGLATRLPPDELRITDVLFKRRTQHPVNNPLLSESSRTKIALQITEVQDLIVQYHDTVRGAVRAFAKSPAQMVADPAGSRLWFEAQIVSLAVNDKLKRNEHLRFLEEASWTKPEEVITAREFREMYRAALSIVHGIDHVGRRAVAVRMELHRAAVAQAQAAEKQAKEAAAEKEKATEKEVVPGSSSQVAPTTAEKVASGPSAAGEKVVSGPGATAENVEASLSAAGDKAASGPNAAGDKVALGQSAAGQRTAVPTEAGTAAAGKGKNAVRRSDFW